MRPPSCLVRIITSIHMPAVYSPPSMLGKTPRGSTTILLSSSFFHSDESSSSPSLQVFTFSRHCDSEEEDSFFKNSFSFLVYCFPRVRIERFIIRPSSCQAVLKFSVLKKVRSSEKKEDSAYSLRWAAVSTRRAFRGCCLVILTSRQRRKNRTPRLSFLRLRISHFS